MRSLMFVACVFFAGCRMCGPDPGLDPGPRGQMSQRENCRCPDALREHLREDREISPDVFLAIDGCGTQHAMTVDFQFTGMSGHQGNYRVSEALNGERDFALQARFATTFMESVEINHVLGESDSRQEQLLMAYAFSLARTIFFVHTVGDRICDLEVRTNASQLP